ncbi:MAG TPA: glycosyltransferase [Candidatus Paceibacterota bacterium]|nr:glycosyltransferase [Candidatus Paceibacterota bacterium]
MGQEVLTFPFLFLAIFFESFVLVTLLSKPARAARARVPGEAAPTVAVIVPCWNEATTVAATCESLLALDYPVDKLEIILVDDGSTDATPAAMAPFAAHPQVRVVRKENGGKHTALNAGIAMTEAEFIGCLDADSFVDPAALREIVPCFAEPKVAAVTAAMSIHQPKNMLQHMQNAEYTFGITLRHTLASINGLYVTPGPFSFYRRSTVNELGGFRHGHQTEDMEMALRLQHAGYEIENAPRARVYTKSPDTLLALIKQRTRWTSGFLRNVLGEYRSLIGSRKHGVLGMLVLPTAVIAIGSTLLLFSVMLFQLGSSVLTALSVRAGIPLSYAYLPHGSFDWFYFPASFYLLLGAATLLTSLSLIIIGKRISRTPGNIGLGLISYTFLYGLIVPLWLARATADVTLGKNRGWRA